MSQVRWHAHRVDDAPCRPRRWFEVAAAHLFEGADPPVGWMEREAGNPDLRDRADRLAGHEARGVQPSQRFGAVEGIGFRSLGTHRARTRTPSLSNVIVMPSFAKQTRSSADGQILRASTMS